MAGARVDLIDPEGPKLDGCLAAPSALRVSGYVNSRTVLGGFILLAVFLTSGLSPIQGDTWWQLRAGRDMWNSQRVLLSDVYSHTASGAFWVNHEWLAEVVFYAVYRSGGLALLSLFAAALITAGWAFTWRLTRGSSMTAFLLTLVALAASSGWWEARPHAFSLLFIPSVVFLLHRGLTAWLPLVFLVWANTHGGVLLGLVLVIAGLAARTIATPVFWRSSLATLAGCIVAMTITPLGPGFWIEIPRSLSRISLYTLDEWSRTELTDPTMLPFWGIAGMYVWHLFEQRRRLTSMRPSDAVLHACAVVMLPAAIAAVRNVGPFLMLAVPALTHLWTHADASEQEPSSLDRRTVRVAVAALSLACVGVVTTLSVAYAQRWARLKWDPISMPAVGALRECPGNLYNRYDEGGMLLWFVPDRKVFLDGRQDPFPSQMVLEHIEMETGRRPYRPTFERHEIGCAFLPHVSPVVEQLAKDGWTSLYRDARWVILRSQ